MIVELRPKSQITIPSEIIKQLSLSSGDKFEAVIKNGILMFIPVTVYPTKYVETLKNEIETLKKQIISKDADVFHDIDDMFASLDKEEKK